MKGCWCSLWLLIMVLNLEKESMMSRVKHFLIICIIMPRCTCINEVILGHGRSRYTF